MQPNTTILLRGSLAKANLVALHHDQGLTIREIAAKLSVSVATVYRAFEYHDVQLQDVHIEYHKHHLRDLLTKDALTAALIDEDLTVAQIAARYDCSVQTIYTYLTRHDIELPERSPKTHKPAGLTVENITALYNTQRLSLQAVAEEVGVSSKALRDFMDSHGIARRDLTHQLDADDIGARYLAGATLQELANEQNCSAWAITKRLDDLGIERRVGKRRPAA